MKFEISIALFLSIACLTAEAFCPEPLASRSSPAFVTSRIPKTTGSRLYSQWDEEEEEAETLIAASPTFEQAGEAIGKEDDKAAMDDMGEFDASSTVSTQYPTVRSFQLHFLEELAAAVSGKRCHSFLSVFRIQTWFFVF